MMRVVVVRRDDVDLAGFIGDAFQARGAELDVHLFPADGSLPNLGGVDHIVLLGSASAVTDGDAWIALELDWLRAATDASVPVLGICLGAHARCAAFGGRMNAMARQGDRLGHDRLARSRDNSGWRLVGAAR
jgi:GMP synthase-like glutamine amidotransferase